MSSVTRQRILAIAPGTRHLGYAVFEDDDLVDFGVRTFEGGRKRRQVLSGVEAYVDKLFARHTPQTLAVEEVFYAQARMNGLLRKQVAQLKRWGRKRRLHVAGYLPTVVKERLCQPKPTRYTLAETMVRRFWFLYAFLKPGRARHYWQQMFDAVGLGVVAAEDAKAARAARSAGSKGARFLTRSTSKTATAAR